MLSVASALIALAAATPNPYVVATIGFGGVLVGAAIGGVVRFKGDQIARRVEGQRAAIYNLQDATLGLRDALAEYGAQGARPEAKYQRAVDRAESALYLTKCRIHSAQLRQASDDWLALAKRYWLNDNLVDLTQEETAWRTIQYLSGQQLRAYDVPDPRF